MDLLSTAAPLWSRLKVVRGLLCNGGKYVGVGLRKMSAAEPVRRIVSVSKESILILSVGHRAALRHREEEVHRSYGGEEREPCQFESIAQIICRREDNDEANDTQAREENCPYAHRGEERRGEGSSRCMGGLEKRGRSGVVRYP